MDVELSPEQPDEVAAAIAAALASPAPKADPWWLAGLEESLATPDAYGEAAGRPRSTRGADRA